MAHRLLQGIAALILTAMSTAQGTWHVQWEPQNDQFSVEAVTRCLVDGKQVFFVWDSFPLLDIGQDEADVRQQQTPKGVRCTVEIMVYVSADDGLHYAASGQSTIVIQEN